MDNRQFYIKEFDNNYYYNFKSEYRFFKFIENYISTMILLIYYMIILNSFGKIIH